MAVPNDARGNDRQYIMFALRIMGDFGASIAIPVVAFAWIGHALDARYGTRPWLLIAGFALAAACSGWMVWTKAKRYGKEYEDLGKEESH